MKILLCGFVALTISIYANHLHPEIDKTVEELLSLMDVPGAAVGIVVDGKTILAKGYGYRNKEDRLPTTAKTMFCAGSLSKALTSFLLGQLVDETTLDWDDCISDHIPYFKLKDPHTTYNITLRDYLTHVSGYPCHEGVWYNQGSSRGDVIKRLRFINPIYPLRDKFLYQNVGYMVAGHVAELIAGKSYETLIEEKIFKPLGMNHSNFSQLAKSDNYALSYTHTNSVVPLIDLSTIAPAGGLNSNIEDLMKWLKLLLKNGEGLIEPSTFEELIRPQVVSNLICNGKYGVENEILMESYGLGWILLSYRGHFLVLHGGGVNGFSSSLLFLPNEQVGVVVLCNKSSSPFPFILSSLLVDKLLDLSFVDWSKKYDEFKHIAGDEEPKADKVSTTPSHPISEYLGTYSHPAYGRIEIHMAHEHLYAKYNHLHLPLDHAYYDVFEISNTTSLPLLRGLKFSFQNNYYGNIQSISIPFEPQLEGIIFTKEKDISLTDELYLKQFAGKYSYLGFTINIEQTDNKLVVKAFGQPPYELYPEKPNCFIVKNLDGYIVEFLIDDLGAITAVQVVQPNKTTYTARRI